MSKKFPLTDYGLKIKIKLLFLNKTQEWLINEVREKVPEFYIDSSNLYKIMTGQIKTSKAISVINEVLGIEEESHG